MALLDGHAAFIKAYRPASSNTADWSNAYDPPPGYDYHWNRPAVVPPG